MRRNKIFYMLVLLTGWCGLGGCYSYTPVRVEVQDMETHAPIADAAVSGCNIGVLMFFPPKHEETRTDKQGIATVKVGQYAIPAVGVEAPGYRRVDVEIPSFHIWGEVVGQEPAGETIPDSNTGPWNWEHAGGIVRLRKRDAETGPR